MLTLSAVVSLTVGIYEDIHNVEYDAFGNKIPGVKWVEGVAIIFAVVLVVVVGSVNDYQKEKQFQSLNAKKEDREVSVSLIPFYAFCNLMICRLYVLVKMYSYPLLTSKWEIFSNSNLEISFVQTVYL